MAIVGGLPVYCPRTNYDFESGLNQHRKCGRQMELLHMADGTEWDRDWAHGFYYCADCQRSVMVTRKIDVVEDPEERI